MSSDNQFTALGPAAVGFQTDGTNIDRGADIFGNQAGIVGKSSTGEGVHGETASDFFAGVAGINTFSGPRDDKKNPTGVFGSSAIGEGVHGETHSVFRAGVSGVMLNPNGTGPGVFGFSAGAGRMAGFFQGNVTVTGDILLPNSGDIAEDFDVLETEETETGTVMVIDDGGGLRRCDAAYDKRVAGVISGAEGLKPGIILNRHGSPSSRRAIALTGKVFCKVDARYSAIEVGDLLTTSPTPGHAMKAGDPQKAFGAVIGKALRAMGSGQGFIPILAALQ
jgi:hypothetical protein